MSRKTKQILKEFMSDHSDGPQGSTFAAEPVETGSPMRPADKQDAEPQVMFTPGSEEGMEQAGQVSLMTAVQGVMDAISGMDDKTIKQLYYMLYNPKDGSVSSPETAMNNMAGIKGNLGTQDPGLNYDLGQHMAINAAAGDTTFQPNAPSVPAMNPSKLAEMAAKEVKKIFGEDLLTEENALKVTTLFESAVNTQVKAETIRVQAALQEAYDENLEAAIELMIENIDSYASEVAKLFVEQNKLSMVDTARLAISENFMSKLSNLLNESYININEEDLNIVSEVTAELENVEEITNSVIKENIELKRQLHESAVSQIVGKALQGLNFEQREQLLTLSETIDNSNLSAFETKLKVLKEQRILTSGNSLVLDNDSSVGILEEQTSKDSSNKDNEIEQLAGKISNVMRTGRYKTW